MTPTEQDADGDLPTAEDCRRLFAGMDEAIAAVVGADAEAAWHTANATGHHSPGWVAGDH